MHGLYPRNSFATLLHDLNLFPAVALVGPRQCGKSTLAREISATFNDAQFLDLEYPPDRARLNDPEFFFERNQDHLVCIDETQFVPELFPILRYCIDQNRIPGRFLLLGSASHKLTNLSSESLAGRICYHELTPFTIDEVASLLPHKFPQMVMAVRGGFPESLLAASDATSDKWRINYLKSFIERDLNMLGLKAPALTLQRLLTMTAHIQSQILNVAKLSESLGISQPTVKSYLDFMTEALILRQLQPWLGNLKKRLIKSPKLYIRDTGLCNALLSIKTVDDLLSHPVWGSNWEAQVIEHVAAWFPEVLLSYFRTAHGAEIDLVLEKGDRRVAIECKTSTAPQVTKGFWNALADLQPRASFICIPQGSPYPIAKNVTVCDLLSLKELVAAALG